MRPDKLYPGDILLYLNHGWLGNLISWGSWTGTSQEALEYSHIGLVLDDLQSCEMNPPASRKLLLSEVPWDRVHVWRLGIDGVEPFMLEAVQAKFQELAVKRLGERYHYGYIATSLGVGLLSRIGLGGVSRWLMNRSNAAPDLHRDVCSTWAEELLSSAIQEWMPTFDLFPDLGENRAKPSDYPRSRYLKRIN